MKNDKFTVTHQNMTQQEMSVRDADHENDLFREAFEAAIKDEGLSAEQQFFALDFFISGWESAVRLLNDDSELASNAATAAPGDLSVESILKIVCENTGKRISLSSGDLDCYIDVARAAILASNAGAAIPGAKEQTK